MRKNRRDWFGRKKQSSVRVFPKKREGAPNPGKEWSSGQKLIPKTLHGEERTANMRPCSEGGEGEDEIDAE